jgi:flagellar L-ring protein precursor FlgH
MTPLNTFTTRLLVATLLALGLVGCAAAPEPLAHSPQFAPVMPVVVEKPRQATGAIYNGRHSDNFFGRSRNYRVGDLITVKLDEYTFGSGNQQINTKRKANNDVIPDGVISRVQNLSLPTKILGTTLSGALSGANLKDTLINSEGNGKAVQDRTLEGQVTVTVVEVLSNGNLMVRGEKQMALTEGAETIQVSGIIRPDDVSPNNEVQSRRLANAQISYRGTGDMANAAKPGWGTRALLSIWPF